MNENLKHKVNPESTALLIIDMQKDYCCQGGILDKLGVDLAPAQRLASDLNNFLLKARVVLKHIVHIRMVLNPDLASIAMRQHYERVGLSRKPNPYFSEPYVITPIPGEIVIPKYRYSGFVSTYLDKFLRNKAIKTLVVTGLATDVCVAATARDGFMLDYHIVVPQDLTEGTNPDAKLWTLRNIETFYGEVVNSKDLLSSWNIG